MNVTGRCVARTRTFSFLFRKTHRDKKEEVGDEETDLVICTLVEDLPLTRSEGQ